MSAEPLNPVQPEVLVPEQIGLLPEDSLAEAGRKILAFYYAAMRRHEPGTRLGSDIEALHDMRVSTRRMRAALEIFAAAYHAQAQHRLVKGLKSTGRALGSVRDWDVFLDKAQHDTAQLSPEFQSALQPILKKWQQARQIKRQKMLKYLDSEDYQKFVRKLSAFVQTTGLGARRLKEGRFEGQKTPLPHSLRLLAPGMIYARLAAVRAYADSMPQANDPQLHALRIDFKRLHYLLDFLRELLAPQAKSVLQTIKRMQDHLGDLHDAQVACEMLEKLLKDRQRAALKHPLEAQPEVPAIAAYLALKVAEREQLLSSFPAAWVEFDQPELRQILAQAISVL